MKRIRLQYLLIAAALLFAGCSLNRTPETDFSDANFWNTESDLKEACNRLYQQLPGYVTDNRADDSYGNNPDATSDGSWQIPNTSGDWNDPYDMIFTANNILEKGTGAQVSQAVRNRYFAEARFFRAYEYFTLVKKYGDVPLVLKPLNAGDPDLDMPRTARATVIDTIYADLDFAAKWLPLASSLPAADYGRVTAGAALAFEARVGLYEGTWVKFHGLTGEDWHQDLQIAVNAASAVMQENYYGLNASYSDLFQHAGDGPGNKENVFVKVYGSDDVSGGTYTNPIVTHDNSRDMENGRYAPTRNLIEQYLCSDGLPWGVSKLTVPETSYNSIFQNRDPRLTMTVYQMGEEAYKGPWVPNASACRTGYACKKGFNLQDWNNNKATVDKPLIRYAEVLLTYAEASFELNGSISDADLDKTINKLRDRVGMPHLTNAFVTANSLDMRTEIRRERTVELALEGFGYDDLIRWKTAENLLPTDILGAKYVTGEWPGTDPASLNLTADSILIVEPASKRVFNAQKDYLYPVPLHEITFSHNHVTQNPGWQ
jgi:hypothetical protein